MKMLSLFLATAVIVAAPAAVYAQSAPSPANQSGTGVSPTTPSPTDPGSGSAAGDVKGIPSRAPGAMDDSTRGTTGSGMQGSGADKMQNPAAESAKKNVSPSSPQEGAQKVK